MLCAVLYCVLCCKGCAAFAVLNMLHHHCYEITPAPSSHHHHYHHNTMALNYRITQAQISLALGLIWAMWAAINTTRTLHSPDQFCQAGIAFHSLVGPGCGLNAILHLHLWSVPH